MKRSFAALLMVGFGVSLLAQERVPVSVPEEEMQKLVIHRVDPVLPPEPGMRLHGTVVLLFQPAEEGPGGALPI